MSERGAASGGWVRRLSFVVLLVAGGSLLATLGFFFFRDNFATHYPMKVVSAAAWRAGAIPWWNMTDGGGQPLAGNPNALTFYPDNILYLLFPPHVAFNLHFLLHLLLGWFAMQALICDAGAPASRRPRSLDLLRRRQGRGEPSPSERGQGEGSDITLTSAVMGTEARTVDFLMPDRGPTPMVVKEGDTSAP